MDRDESVVPNPGLPRGVADLSVGVGYVGEPAGTVAAFGLSDGGSLWRAPAPGIPTAVGEGRVFVADAEAPGVLRLLAVAAATGEVVDRREVGLDLDAAGPRLTIYDLNLSARVTEEGLELEWSHREGYQGGAPPSREVEERFSRHQAGALRYSPEAGSVERLPAPRQPPALASFPYRQHGRWRQEGWLSAGALSRLRMEAAEGRLWLESWPRDVTGTVPGEPVKGEVVWRGEEVEPAVTSAGSHLFLRRTRPPGGRWHCFTVPAGEPAGELPWEEGWQWPEVAAGRVFHLATAPGGDLALRALELASGRHLWDRALASASGPRRSPPPPPG